MKRKQEKEEKYKSKINIKKLKSMDQLLIEMITLVCDMFYLRLQMVKEQRISNGFDNREQYNTIDNDQLWSIEFLTRRNVLIHTRKV